MRTKNNGQRRNTKTYRRLFSALVIFSTAFPLQGCKTMAERQAIGRAIGEGLIGANQAHQDNLQRHRELIEWQNANIPRYQLQRAPVAPQPVMVQPVAPAYSNNPSQQFLNQGLWAIPGGQ